MTNEKFERLQREKFKHLSLDELFASSDRLNNLEFPRHSHYTLMDEIANEIDRREDEVLELRFPSFTRMNRAAGGSI